ncbi:MAG: hypothetical protein HY898_31740 [Deltaproteobacteria bacterium]|nr:hypothetical protein [Deltaproteobacteria bacterium]
MGRAAWSVLLAVGIGLAAPATAHAQASPKDKAAAEALFLEAKKMMEADQYQDACPKLEESHKQDPAAGTLMYLAHCYEKTKRPARAWATWRAAESMARAAGKAEREKTSREKAEALESTLSSLRINVPADAKLPGLEIKRDGEVVAPASWGEAAPIDQGDHEISVTAPGRKPWKASFKIGAARSKETVEIPVLETEGAAAAPASTADKKPSEPPTAAQDASPASFWTQQKIGFVVGAAGLVGLGAGAYFGLRASSKEKDSNSHCMAENQNWCDETGLALNKQAQDAEKVAIGAFVAGGVLTAAGIVLVLTAPSGQPTSAPKVGLAPRVAPGFGGWVLSGNW